MSDHLDGAQLSRLIDGDLSLASRDAVRAHLHECPHCAQRHDELVAVAASLRQLPAVEWSAARTQLVTTRLVERPRRNRVGVTVAAGVASGLCVAALFAALPVLTIAVAIADPVARLASAVTPGPILAAAPMLLVIAVVAVLAPLAAYPLARWR